MLLLHLLVLVATLVQAATRHTPRFLNSRSLGATFAPQPIASALLGFSNWRWWEIIHSFRGHNRRTFATQTNFIYYTLDISIGTPGQPFTLMLDTTSPDLWVMSKGCHAAGCKGQPLYDASLSKTANVTSIERSFNYLFGRGSGVLAIDTVSINTESFPSQEIILAKNLSHDIFAKAGIQGIAGMSLPFPNSTVPLWKQFANTKFGILLKPVDRHARGTIDGGKLDVGDFDPRYITGRECWVRAKRSIFWAIPVDGVVVKGHKVCNVTNHTGILSTSSTFILGHPAIVEDFYRGIPNSFKNPHSGLWEWPCPNGRGRDVHATWNLGGITYRVGAKNLIHDIVGGNCQGTILDDPFLNRTGVDWVLGQPFLINVYLAFQDNGAEGPRFAFQPINEPTVVASSLRLPARTSAPARRNQVYCPDSLTACPLNGEDYECIDTLSELSSCGGCVRPVGENSHPSGVDCTALPGVIQSQLTCTAGKCVSFACRKGFRLLDGRCTKGA